MDKFWPTVIVVVVVVLVFATMWLAWRIRARRDAGLQPIHELPADLGAALSSVDAFYVATTEHDNALERLAVEGLGFRAKARAAVYDAGIVLEPAGESAVFVPSARITGVRGATVAIDRVVEPGGLIAISWRIDAQRARSGDRVIDSFLRLVSPGERAGFIEAIHSIAATADAADDTESEA